MEPQSSSKSIPPKDYTIGTELPRCQTSWPTHLSLPTLKASDSGMGSGKGSQGTCESCPPDVWATCSNGLMLQRELSPWQSKVFLWPQSLTSQSLQIWLCGEKLNLFRFLRKRAQGGLEDGLVGQVLTTQTWGSMFKLPHPYKSEHANNPSAGGL